MAGRGARHGPVNALFDLTGKVALITGARSGLGQAIAQAFAEAGADIAGLGSSAMPDMKTSVTAAGRRFHEVRRDLSTPVDFGAVVAEIVDRLGGVDILVNNAGIIRRRDVLNMTEDDWDTVMSVNLRSAFFLSQAVARHMVETGRQGRIINIGSLLSFQGGIRIASYTASKHGIAGVTKLMANELAPKGITVNAIAPGYFATDNTEALRADEARSRQILDRIPAGRWGNPGDIATAALFLAAPASGYVTGTVVAVDGGWLAR